MHKVSIVRFDPETHMTHEPGLLEVHFRGPIERLEQGRDEGCAETGLGRGWDDRTAALRPRKADVRLGYFPIDGDQPV